MLSFELLQALLSPDAGIRDQAETVFRSIPVLERVQGLTNFLLTNSGNSNDQEGVLLLTSVLLRRDILKLTDPSLLNELVAPLLEMYGKTPASNPSTRPIKVAVGHCLAEIGSSLSLMESSTTSAVVSKIVEASVGVCMASAGDLPNLLCSLKLLAALADRAPIAFATVGLQSLEGLTGSVMGTLSNNSNHLELWTSLLEVIVNGALGTTVQEVSLIRGAETSQNLDDLVIDVESPAAQIGSRCLLPVLKSLLSSKTVVSLEFLNCLTHATVTCPSLVCGSLEVLETFVQVCLALSMSEDTELSLAALQVLASLVSVGDVRHRVLSPAMAQKLAETVVPVCAQTMASDDDDEWIHEPATLVEDGVETMDGDDASSFAESLLESFFQNLATPALAVALPLVQQLLDPAAAQNWKHGRAGLAILECGLVAAPFALSAKAPEILMSAANHAQADAHPRVRYQAIRLLGAICETHPSVRETHSQVLLERTAAALGSPLSKISSLASQVIVSYCRGDGDSENEEEFLEESLLPFLSDILQALIQGPLSKSEVDTGSVTVKVRAMTATACLAEASGEAFVHFYAHVMPGLMACLSVPQAEVSAAALQSLTIVGQAVGKEVFESDAHQVLAGIVPVLSNASASSFANEELLSACARIATVLEEDFAPYLEAVLPSLYQVAKAPADISIEEGSEQGLQNDHGNSSIDEDGSMTVAIPGKGFQRITINTSAILEKATNNRIMFELAKALGATFGPKVQEAIEIFLPLTKFAYSADVRSTAAQALSALFDSACAHAEVIGERSLPQHYLPLISDSISEQIASEDPSDMEALYALADSLSEVYYIAYRFRNSNNEEILQKLPMMSRVEVVKRCMKTMTDCLGRRDGIARILQGNLSGEDEQEEYAGQLRAEDSLLTPLVDSIGYLLKFSKAEFCPVFEQYVVPNLGKYLSSTSDARASLAAMCLFDDIVEHGGPDAAAKYSPILLQGAMVVMSDPSKFERDLVQAAVYGVAQMSRYAPSNVLSDSNTLQTLVHQLLAITQGNKEDAGDGVYLFEIAVSALASLVLFGPFADAKFVNKPAVQDAFLKSLPLQEDEDEAKICHAGLCHLVEKGAIDLQAEGPRIFRIAGSILADVQEGNDVAGADTCERLMKVLYDLQNQNPQGMQQIIAELDPSIQNIIGYAVQDYARSRSNVVTP